LEALLVRRIWVIWRVGVVGGIRVVGRIRIVGGIRVVGRRIHWLAPLHAIVVSSSFTAKAFVLLVRWQLVASILAKLIVAVASLLTPTPTVFLSPLLDILCFGNNSNIGLVCSRVNRKTGTGKQQRCKSHKSDFHNGKADN
jgi:hypothetical protein